MNKTKAAYLFRLTLSLIIVGHCHRLQAQEEIQDSASPPMDTNDQDAESEDTDTQTEPDTSVEPDAAGESKTSSEEHPEEIWIPEIAEDPIYEIVVTATRFDTALGNVPATVTIIDDEDAENLPSNTADDILRTQSSLSIQRHQGMGNAYPITLHLRGIEGAGRTLLLLDGQPLNNALTGSANLNMLPRDRIQRIEIVRGPFSSLYGSRAMAGVIHVITKPGGIDPGVGVSTALGPNASYVVAPFAANQVGPFELSLSYERRATDNYLSDEAQPNLDYEHHKLHARADLFRKRDVSVMATGGFNTSQMGFNQYIDLRNEPSLGFYVRNEGRNAKDNAYGNLSLQAKPIEEWELVLNGGGFFQEQRFHSVPVVLEGTLPGGQRAFAVEESIYKAQEWRLEALSRWSPADWLGLVCGFEQAWDVGRWRTEEMETGLRVTGLNAKTPRQAGYLQSELSFFDSVLSIIAGARLDHHPQFGFAFSPKAGASVKATPTTTIRASGGKAFRAPSLMELYSPPWQRIPPYLTEGNPDLEPETIYSADIGIEQKINDLFKGRVTGFFNYGNNLISLKLDGSGTERYLNIEEIVTAGAEVELDLRPFRGLKVTPNYTYTFSRDTSTKEELDYTPQHLLGLAVVGQKDWSWGYLTAAFDMHMIGPHWYSESRSPENRYHRDAYAVGNARIQLGWERFAVFADAYNLWDMRYQQTAGIDAARFQFLVGLRMEADWPKSETDASPDL